MQSWCICIILMLITTDLFVPQFPFITFKYLSWFHFINSKGDNEKYLQKLFCWHNSSIIFVLKRYDAIWSDTYYDLLQIDFCFQSSKIHWGVRGKTSCNEILEIKTSWADSPSFFIRLKNICSYVASIVLHGVTDLWGSEDHKNARRINVTSGTEHVDHKTSMSCGLKTNECTRSPCIFVQFHREFEMLLWELDTNLRWLRLIVFFVSGIFSQDVCRFPLVHGENFVDDTSIFCRNSFQIISKM